MPEIGYLLRSHGDAENTEQQGAACIDALSQCGGIMHQCQQEEESDTDHNASIDQAQRAGIQSQMALQVKVGESDGDDGAEYAQCV